RHEVDLFTLLPLGELAVAAARLGDQARLAPRLAEARALLAALGDPPLWAGPLHWNGLHAAILADDREAAAEHAAALATGPADHYRGLLAAAARCWLAVLAGDIDPDEVEEAARGLHGTGLYWDAARLAGQAAIRTSDRRAMVRLLDVARLLQGRELREVREARRSRPPEETPAEAAEDGESTLSARELEVAELAVGGLTYKEIGGRLFISAKTVEHHMARMRQKLGCANRSELLAQLRRLRPPDR
ncbi:MAG TPA: helix-turn-helix transcriptional regulator, partial [Pseudonocardiaceae bacterium]